MNIYELIETMSREHKTIFDMPLKVTFYARVSTKKEEQINSQENQVQTFTELIKNNPNWQLVDGYIDTIRGESTLNRDNFQKMITDAKLCKFDLIICKEISRFSRDLLDSISYTRELFRNNVGVYFTSDNLCTIDRDSELRLGIMASIAQEEVSRLSTRVKFGQKKAIESGVVMGNSRIFGYIKKDGKLLIDPKEGEMVKMIYDLYSTGDYSLRNISDLLYEKGYRNHNGNQISHTTIKSIIQNPKNKGYYCGNKVKILDYRTKKQKFLPENEWLLYKDESGSVVPAIVDEELWNTCNEMLSKRCISIKSGNQGGKRFTSPLSGKIICGHCNKSFHHNSYNHGRSDGIKWHWICQVKKHKTSSCPTFSIRDTEILKILQQFFNVFIKDIDRYINKYIDIYNECISNDNSTRKIIELQNEINKLEYKKDKLLDLYTDEIISKEDFKKRNDKLQFAIDELQFQIDELSNVNNNIQDKINSLDYIKQYFQLNNFDETNETLIYELSKTMIEKIIINPVDDSNMNVIIVPFTGEQHQVSLQKYGVTNGNIIKKMIPIVTQDYIRVTLRNQRLIRYHVCLGIN